MPVLVMTAKYSSTLSRRMLWINASPKLLLETSATDSLQSRLRRPSKMEDMPLI